MSTSDAQQTTQGSTTSAVHAPGAAPRANVLIIEDDPTLLLTLSYNLRRNGFDVLGAADGDSGLRAARTAPQFDLVVLDLMLPGINGFQVLRMLRSSSDVPVLILSAKGEEQDRIDGLELGADDYIVKPFAMREFVARTRAAIRRRAIPAVRPPAALYRDPLLIEPDRRRVYVNGTEVFLRPKEFGLLLTLAMEPGRLYCRQELLDEVWGEDIIVDERTVDVHVSWLRGKLNGAGAPPDTIKTVYGSGYRFRTASPFESPLQANATSNGAEREGRSLLDAQSG